MDRSQIGVVQDEMDIQSSNVQPETVEGNLIGQKLLMKMLSRMSRMTPAGSSAGYTKPTLESRKRERRRRESNRRRVNAARRKK